jgi:hypothetical protein
MTHYGSKNSTGYWLKAGRLAATQEPRTLRQRGKMPALMIEEDLSTERDSDEVMQTPASMEIAETDSEEESDDDVLRCRDNAGRVHHLRIYCNRDKELVKKIGIAEAENFPEKQDLTYAKSLRFMENSMPHYSIEEMYNDWKEGLAQETAFY